MHQVEIVHSFFQFAVCTHAESLGLSKSAFEELGGFNNVGQVVEFPVRRETTGVLIVKNIEAGQLMKSNARVENGVRLPTEYLNMVT